jgi:N-acetylglucosamine kinase-like BadF-type ATPase
MILLIESGSTKTEWRFIANPNEAYDSFFSAGINPYYQSAIEINTSQNDVKNWLTDKKVEQIYYYGTGITGEDKVQIIREFLLTIIQGAEIQIENDLMAAAKASCGDEKGIACILGTGSNSGFFDGQKITEQIPPLGFWLGDEGSGGHLGKNLVLSYLHHEMPEELRTSFIARFGELNRLGVLEKAYRSEFPNRWFASFSKFIFQHRKEPFCYQLIEHSFQQFCSLYILKYTHAHDYPIHFTGSVAFYYSDILKRVLNGHKLKLGHISEAPMAGLTLYHKNKHWPKTK